MNSILSIWTKPLETFSYLKQRSVDGKDNHIEFLLAILTSCIAFPAIISRMNTYEIPQMLGFVLALTLGPLMGLLIFKYVFSWFIWKIGKILQGKATLHEVQLVVAYTSIGQNELYCIPWFVNQFSSIAFYIPKHYLRTILFQ